MRWRCLALVLVTMLAGCAADPGLATFRFAGPLDRALTDAEQDEVRRLAGKDFNVEATDLGCTPDVDPYDCNEHWLRVDDVTARTCDDLVDRLGPRTYWRRAPTCSEPV